MKFRVLHSETFKFKLGGGQSPTLAESFKIWGVPELVGRLTTHVLDTARGTPAEAIAYKLFRVAADGGRTFISEGITNADGRSDAPLLSDSAMEAGSYILEFDVAGYHKATGQLPKAPFLGLVPLGFQIEGPGQHLHVPLLVSPFGYTTYRGS